MSRILIVLFLAASGAAFGQRYDYSIGQQMEKLDSIAEWLVEYEQLGIKTTGSSELNTTRDWITARLKNDGYAIGLDSFEYNSHTLQNIVVEKPGLQSNSWIILGAHYDSYPGSAGANDNGTGVVALLQIARIMQSIETEIGVRFIFFSAEENGLIGSKHYVANSLSTDDDIQLMLNLDQLGGTKGVDNSKIYCERDEHMNPSSNNSISWLKTDTLSNLVRAYSFLTPVIDRAFSSDYIPFQDSGYTITGLYQHSHYPFYHQSGDLVANMNLNATKQVIQVALAAGMYFARNTLPVSIRELDPIPVRLYPNPARNQFHISSSQNIERISIHTFSGREIRVYESFQDSYRLDGLSPGVYSVHISLDSSSAVYVSKLIIAP